MDTNQHRENITDDLITRLQAATGPDERMDEAIALSLGWSRGEWNETEDGVIYQEWISPEGEHLGVTAAACVPGGAYTRDIDAALKLVLPNRSWRVGNTPSAAFAQIGTSLKEHYGATPALALCVAALRDRQGGTLPGSTQFVRLTPDVTVSAADAEAIDRDMYGYGNAFVHCSDGVGRRLAPQDVSVKAHRENETPDVAAGD